MADDLDTLRACPLTQHFDPLLAHLSIRPGESDLYQFMGVERGFEFADNGIREPVLADADKGMAVMCAAAQMRDLFAG